LLLTVVVALGEPSVPVTSAAKAGTAINMKPSNAPEMVLVVISFSLELTINSSRSCA
jgi:hypothetical protein